jgi:hypothetical protein
LLAQVTHPAEPSEPSGAERRRAPRFKRESNAQLIVWPASTRTAPITVRLVDYSRTGVGLLHDEAILIGQKFVLREPFVTRDSTCIYTVARCQKRHDGHFIIGLHVATASDAATEPAPAPDENRLASIGFFLFALIGAIGVVAMAIFNR